MGYRFINIKLLNVYLTVLVISSSCTFYQPVNTANKDVITSQKNLKINKVEKAKISININQYEGFEKKAYSGAILPKKSNNISLYKVFLSKNINNPFESTSMISGIQNVIPDDTTKKGNAVFSNIPDGGPYYAIVSAYEKINVNNDSSTGVEYINITEPNSSLQSIDKKWSISTNSVNVNLGKTIFSDNGNNLKISLNLQSGIPSKVDNSIQIYTGASASPVVNLSEEIN